MKWFSFRVFLKVSESLFLHSKKEGQEKRDAFQKTFFFVVFHNETFFETPLFHSNTDFSFPRRSEVFFVEELGNWSWDWLLA